MRIAVLEPRHAPLLFEALRDPAIYAFIDDEPPASLDDLARRFERYASGGRGDEVWRNWVMFDGDEPVGTLQATIYPSPDRHAEIAYVVVPARWRCGHASRGVAWLLDHLRDDGVVRAVARIDARNLASIGVIEKLGFARRDTIGGDHRYERRLR